MSRELSSGPAVVVMARAPRPGQVRRALEPLLGPAGCAALQAALIVAAVRWAHAVAPGAVYVAYDPPDAAREMRALLPAESALFPQNGDGIGRRVADATARVFARHDGPVLVVWPDLPRLRPDHATAALDDLRAGCDAALGPVIDGGFYLIAIDARSRTCSRSQSGRGADRMYWWWASPRRAKRVSRWGSCARSARCTARPTCAPPAPIR